MMKKILSKILQIWTLSFIFCFKRAIFTALDSNVRGMWGCRITFRVVESLSGSVTATDVGYLAVSTHSFTFVLPECSLCHNSTVTHRQPAHSFSQAVFSFQSQTGSEPTQVWPQWRQSASVYETIYPFMPATTLFVSKCVEANFDDPRGALATGGPCLQGTESSTAISPRRSNRVADDFTLQVNSCIPVARICLGSATGMTWTFFFIIFYYGDQEFRSIPCFFPVYYFCVSATAIPFQKPHFYPWDYHIQNQMFQYSHCNIWRLCNYFGDIKLVENYIYVETVPIMIKYKKCIWTRAFIYFPNRRGLPCCVRSTLAELVVNERRYVSIWRQHGQRM